jgi:hypothetical protein
MPKKIPVPPRLLSLAREQAGLVSSEQCDAAGVGPARRRNLITGGSWRRVKRGVFDTGDVRTGLHPYDVDRLRSAWTALLTNSQITGIAARRAGEQDDPRTRAHPSHRGESPGVALEALLDHRPVRRSPFRRG